MNSLRITLIIQISMGSREFFLSEVKLNPTGPSRERPEFRSKEFLSETFGPVQNSSDFSIRAQVYFINPCKKPYFCKYLVYFVVPSKTT